MLFEYNGNMLAVEQIENGVAINLNGLSKSFTKGQCIDLDQQLGNIIDVDYPIDIYTTLSIRNRELDVTFNIMVLNSMRTVLHKHISVKLDQTQRIEIRQLLQSSAKG